MELAEELISLLFISFSCNSISSIVISGSESSAAESSARPNCRESWAGGGDDTCFLFPILNLSKLLAILDLGAAGAVLAGWILPKRFAFPFVPVFFGSVTAPFMVCLAICLFCKCGINLGPPRLFLPPPPPPPPPPPLPPPLLT